MLQLILTLTLSTTSCFGFGLVVKPRRGFVVDDTVAVDPSPHSTTTTYLRPPLTALGMAKGGVHGKRSRMIKATKKRKNKKPSSSPGKHRKTSKRDAQSGDAGQSKKQSPSSPIGKVVTANTKTSGPPWQVMGQKDAKKNVELEKVRRERIRDGLDKVRTLGLCAACTSYDLNDVWGSTRVRMGETKNLSERMCQPRIVSCQKPIE